MFDIKKFIQRYRYIFLTGIILALLPLSGSDYALYVFTFASIYLTAAASFDIFTGHIGDHNLGYSLFFGIGAYTTALLGYYFNVHPIVSLPVGGVLAALAALACGLPCLRLRGPYFSMAMISISEIARLIILKSYAITHGDDGLPTPPISSSLLVNYYSALALALCVVLLYYTLSRSNIGLIFKTIREDRFTSEAIGVDVTKYKVIAFMISAIFGGVAGGFFASFLKLADPGRFAVTVTSEVFFISYIGGSGTILGSIIGAYTLFPLTEYLRLFLPGLFRYIFYSILLAVIIKFAPKGLYGLIETAYKKYFSK